MDTPEGVDKAKEKWRRDVTTAIGREVARLRNKQGMSAESLGRRCSDLGYPMARNSVMNLEHGRNKTIPVHEVVVIATALGVAPIDLLFPPNQMTRYLPNDEIACFEAVERFTGRPAEPTTWADTLRRLLTDREGHALLNVVNAIQARARG